jgi:hypothetical protein
MNFLEVLVIALPAAGLVAVGCGARTDLVLSTGSAGNSSGWLDAGGGQGTSVDAARAQDGVAEAEAMADAGTLRDASDEPEAEAAVPHTLAIAFLGTSGAFDEDRLLAFLTAYPAQVTRLSDAPALTQSTLTGVDILVLDQLSRTFDSGEAATLATWVEEGGAVLSLTGFNNTSTDAAMPDSLLADLPLGYAPSFVGLTPAISYATTFAPSAVTAGLSAVPFWGGHAVVAQSACEGSMQDVASLEGTTVGAICVQGAGRIYLWGDEWVEYSSQWTASTDTQAFWQDAIDWLAAPALARTHPG